MMLLLALLASSLGKLAHAASFEEYFSRSTLRLELLHQGDGDRESIIFQGLRREGFWPGSRVRTLDRTNLGAYRFEIVDLAEERVIYSRAHGCFYREWAKNLNVEQSIRLTFPESLRFPEPRKPFQIRLSKRSADQSFQETWRGSFDPKSRFIDGSAVESQQVWTLVENGPTLTKVDLLFLGDGYPEEELPKYHADVGRLSEALLRSEPFASHRSTFSIRAIDTPTKPSENAASDSEPETALGASYDPRRGERLALMFDERRWREVAAAAPYDFVIILAN